MMRIIKFFLVFGIFLNVSALCEDLEFDFDTWKEMRHLKEEEKFEKKTVIGEEEKEKKEEKEEQKQEKKEIAIELPAKSQLKVSGKQTISIGFGKVFYTESDPGKRTISAGGLDGLNMEQSLNVKIKGKIGRKIDVDINYDGQIQDLNRRNIQITYTGDPNEFIQKVQFGDVKLSLPGTEFVSYSGAASLDRNLFGFMGQAKYKDLRIYFVGSQTKGRNEIKKFTGSTKFEKKEIYDTNYQNRKYYKIYISTSYLPIAKGSEKIYLDDKESSNNEAEITQEMDARVFGTTTTYHGFFDLLKPGIDYVIDYTNGIITFYTYTGKNHVIACDWTASDGEKISQKNSGYPVLIKDENETLPYKLMNRYFLGDTNILRDPLGENFVVKILDNTGSEKDANGKYYIDYLNYEVDYELGIIRFEEERPFEYLGNQVGIDCSDVYDPSKTGQKLHFSVYVEYRTQLNTYLLRPNIVRNSEKIAIDGATLKKNIDYIIDYYTGWITFLNTDKITETSVIEAVYEYYPFIGGQEQTLVGTRFEFKPTGNFSLGGTMIYNFSPVSAQIPNIYQASPTTLLLDLNSSFTINPKKYFPFRISASGEIARSENTPNRSGKAIVEDMEGIKQKDAYPTYEDAWKPASIGDPTSRMYSTWNEVDGIKIIDLNSSYFNDDDETSALAINYSGSGAETAIAYPISNAGADYTQKEFFECYIWGEGKNEEITFELGSFNEDADGDGVLDTEDKNNDFFLNEGEDVGVEFNVYGSSYVWFRWGIDNGRIDTEDLDGDGVLSTSDEAIFSTKTVVNWSGWKKIQIPLTITEANKDAWRAIKQIRITLKKGASSSGEVKIAEMGTVGNKWEKPTISGSGTFDIYPVNNVDNSDYSGKSLIWRSDFQKLYDLSDKEIREQTLKIVYDLSPNATAYTYATYSRMDFTIYGKINFYAYGSNTGNTFFIRFGNDEKNYFEYKFKDDFSGWKLFGISLDDKNYDGVPDGFSKKIGSNLNLNNITRIYFGIYSGNLPASGEILLNDIYVSDVKKEVGVAKKAQAGLELPGWGKLSGSIRKIDSDFRSLSFNSTSDQTTWDGNLSITKLKWLPISGSIKKSVTTTPRENINLSQAPMAQYLSFWDEGKVETLSYFGKAELKIRRLPQISGDYSHSITSASLQGKVDISDKIHGRVSYTLPNLLILPRSFSVDGTRQTTETQYSLPNSTDTGNITESLSGSFSFPGLKLLNFTVTPKYSRQKIGKKIDEELQHVLQKQTLGGTVSGNLKLIKWLGIRFSYQANVDENYNAPSSTRHYHEGITDLKDINRNSSADLSFPLNFRSIFNFSPTNSLNLNYSIKITDGDIYKNVASDFYALNKLLLRDKHFDYKPLEVSTSAILYSYTTSRNDAYSMSYKPFEFLKLSGILTPIKTMDLTLNRTHNQTSKEETQTFSRSETILWPDARVRISSLEKIPVFSKNFSNINTLIEYQKNKKIQEKISINTTRKNGYTLNFTWKKYNINVKYSISKNQNFNLQQNILATRSTNQSWSTGFNFDPWKKWHSNIGYNGLRNKGFGTGGKVTADTLNHKLTLKLNSDTVRLEKYIKLPFSKKPVYINQNVRYNIDFSATLNKSSLNVDKTNYQIYTANFSMDFRMSANFRWSLGAGLKFANYTKRKENNYLALNFNTRLEIFF